MPELTEQLPNVVEACADRVDQYHRRIADETPMESLIEKTDSVSTQNGGALQKLISAVVELQALLRVR